MMRRLFRVAKVVAVGLLSLAAGCGDQALPGPPIPIAATFNLTGQMGEYDVPVEQAVRLAVKQRNAAGGINGRQIQYTAFDGASDAGQAQTATNAAISSGAVAVIGFDDTSSILNAAPLIQKAGIPYITAGATSPRLLVLGGSSIFLEAYGDNVQAAAAAEFAHDQLHAQRAALLTNIGQEYSSGLSRYFTASWNKLVPGGVVFSDTYQINDVDFTAQIGRLRAVDPPPDALYVPATSPDEMVPLLAALRAAFPTTPILGGDNYDGAPVLTINGQAMSNIYYTTHGQWPPVGPGPAQDFATAYEKEYGKPPGSIFPALAYEGTQLLFDALSRAKGTDPAAIRQALESTKNFAGVTGTLSYSADPGGHIPNKSVAVMQIQNGQVKLAQMLTPRNVPAP